MSATEIYASTLAETLKKKSMKLALYIVPLLVNLSHSQTSSYNNRDVNDISKELTKVYGDNSKTVAKGKVKQISETHYFKISGIDKFMLGEKKIFEYNIDGNMDKAVLDPETLSFVHKYSYDENRRLMEENLYMEDTHLRRTTYMYNSADKVIEIVSFDHEKKPFLKIVYAYSNNQETISQYAETDTISIVVKTYNENKLKVKETGRYHFFGIQRYITTYTYDKSNRLVNTIHTETVEPVQKIDIKYSYDAFDNLISVKYISLPENKTEYDNYSYQIDSFGNWISMIYNGKKDEFKIERKIEYWE